MRHLLGVNGEEPADEGDFHYGKDQGRGKENESELLTFWPHADREALFESTLLAFAPHVHVNVATIAVLALVDGILRYTPPEESF